ncbi:MAG: rhomboid family intramembrane serine protease [Akkermansiaceae bacterium]|nr:rhomboid family intramembrane serine protease [Akkermansiaceae bacterium]
MTDPAADTPALPVWARDTAFPESPGGWGWADSKDKRTLCASQEELSQAVISDEGGSVSLVWTPETPRMVLPEEVPALNQAVAASRAKWARGDLDHYTARLRRGLIFFSIIFAWVFYGNYRHVSGTSSFGALDSLAKALRATLNHGFIEIGFLLLIMFVLIPWYQARKRYNEQGRFSTPAGLSEAVPAMRFETWLERRKAPFTLIFLGLITLVGVAQLLSDGPQSSIKAAGLVKDAYRAGEWWRLFTAPFMHGHPIHFLMNAAALLYLGKRLEVFARWPHLPMVFLFSAVVGGQASAQFLKNADSVGASGGLMGWLGFLLVFETLHARLVPRSARRRLAAAVFLTALIGLIGHRFIDNAAHAGGLVAGMLYAAIVFPKSSSVYRPQSTLTDRIGGSLALAACAASAAFAIWKICAPA